MRSQQMSHLDRIRRIQIELDTEFFNNSHPQTNETPTLFQVVQFVLRYITYKDLLLTRVNETAYSKEAGWTSEESICGRVVSLVMNFSMVWSVNRGGELLNRKGSTVYPIGDKEAMQQGVNKIRH